MGLPGLTRVQADKRYSPVGRAAAPRRRRGTKTTVIAATLGTWTMASGTGAFNANDPDAALGTRSASYTTVTGEQFATISVSTPGLDMTGKGVVVWLRVAQGGSLLTRFVLDIGTDGTFASFFRANLPSTSGLSRTLLTDGKWHPIYVPWSQFTTVTGTPTRAALGAIRINPGSSGAGGAQVKVGGVATYLEGDSAYPTGVASFTFDDCSDTQYTVAVPKLSQYGYPATLFPIVERIGTGGCLTSAQVTALRDVYGWEIGAHCMTNAQHISWAGASTTDLEQMCLDMRAWQAANGHRSESMAWPVGPFDAPAVAVAGRYYRYIRTNDGRTNSVVMPDQTGAAAIVLSSGTTLAAAQAAVTRAVADKTWVTFVVHDLVATGGTTNAWTPSDFNALVDFVATSGIDVAPVGDVMALR